MKSRKLGCLCVLAFMMATLPGCPSQHAAAPVAPASHPAGTSSADLLRKDPTLDDAGVNAANDPKIQRIGRMLARIEAGRGIQALHQVAGQVIPRDTLIARIKAHVDDEVPPEVFDHQGIALKLMGFIPLSLDYRASMYSLLEAQVAGYYEPASKTMFLASDLDDVTADNTLAHELVHALQDQQWDLQKRSHYVPGHADRMASLAGLIEGDATSAMLDITYKDMRSPITALDVSDAQFRKVMMMGIMVGPGAEVPNVMKQSLIFPYVEGFRFVNMLRRRGGWAEVDRAWETPPETTEQLLHTEKWDAHEPAETVPPPGEDVIGDGWTNVERESYGELGLRLSLGEWVSTDRAVQLAAGWGGDEGILLSKGDAKAHLFRLRYDQTIDAHDGAWAAERLFTALVDVFVRRFGGPGATRTSTFYCSERKELGPLMLARQNRDVLLVAGPAISRDGKWLSAARCEQVRAWSKAIFSK